MDHPPDMEARPGDRVTTDRQPSRVVFLAGEHQPPVARPRRDPMHDLEPGGIALVQDGPRGARAGVGFQE